MVRQAGLLFGIESLAHVVDYAFHLYLGRALEPGSFAAFQSYFTLAMLFITVASILQPPVSRYVAAPPKTPSGPATAGAILRAYLWQGLAAGVLAAGGLALAVPLLARATHLPAPMVRLIAVAMPLALVRPVLLGLLQGQRRFGSYGAITLLYAVVRLALALGGIGLSGERAGPQGAHLAALTVPVALVLAVGLGMALARRELRQPGRLPWPVARRGWQLSLVALMMAVALMALMGLDVIWVNRSMAADVAGTYARALVLRRVVSFVPIAIGIVLFPRVAALGRRAGRPVLVGLGLALASGAALTALYSLWGHALGRLAFGEGLATPVTWLGGMAWAMTGYGLVSVWVNVYIATEPLPFGYLLAAAAPLQLGLYLWLGHTPEAVIAILAGTGWLLALAGAALYLLRSRNALDSRRNSG